MYIPMKILFVCTGNICRSPTAHGVLRDLALKQGVNLEVDSAGLLDYHEGDNADPRTIAAAAQRGYDLTDIISRPVERDDFYKFDYIFAMDTGHLKALRELCPPSLIEHKKIQLFMDYSQSYKSQSVPDPYYGRGDGFELVLDMIEEASLNFLKALRSD